MFLILRTSGIMKEISTNSVSIRKLMVGQGTGIPSLWIAGPLFYQFNQFSDAVNCTYERCMLYCDIVI